MSQPSRPQASPSLASDGIQVAHDEVVAALDPLGRALFEVATYKVLADKLFARIAELEQGGES